MTMGTIDGLFNHLLTTSARPYKNIALLDRNLRLHCSSPIFLEWLEKTYTRTTLLKKSSADDFKDICIIDCCDNYKQWRDLLPDEPLRVLEDPFVGRCLIYQVPDGLVLHQTNGWVVFRSTDGPLVFLNENPLEKDGQNKWPNPTGLVSILFSEILARSNKWLVHAGAAGYQGRCHLWTGHSGIGKTTRTLAHVAKGYTFFGDDMLVLGKSNSDQWQVWPFWRPIHISQHTCELLPTISGVHRPFLRKNKSSVEIDELFEVTPPAAAPLEVIWLLTKEEKIPVQRLETKEAFAWLSQNFMHGFWPETTQANLEALLDIVFQVPVFKMSRTAPLTQMADELYVESTSR